MKLANYLAFGLIVVAILGIGAMANSSLTAQTFGAAAQVWIPSGGYLKLFDATYGVQIQSLPSEDCIGTDINGKLQSGTCTGGSGGSGTVSTSTNESKGFLSYWTSDSATPALLGEVATTSLTINSPLTTSGTAGALVGGSNLTVGLDTSGTWTGNAGTATALAANGSNCSAGSGAGGVSASGAAEDCVDYYSALSEFTGTLTDGKICVYDLAGGEIDCNYTDQVGGGSTDSVFWASASTSPWVAQSLTALSSSTIAFLDSVRATSTDHFSTNATTSFLRINTGLSFGGVAGDAWSDFCTSITGGAGLCDGADADTTYTAGDALTLTGTDFDFDGGATPSGDLGNTWASPTVTNVTCTDCINATEIEDIYLLNNGDTGSGAYGWSGLHTFTGGVISVASSSLAFYDSVLGTTTNATSSNLRVSNSFSFGGVSGDAWSDFCTSITGSADLCDGGDAVGAGGSTDAVLWANASTSPWSVLSLNANSSSSIAFLSSTRATSTDFFNTNATSSGIVSITTHLRSQGTTRFDNLTSALILTGTTGLLAEYTGSGCTNQLVEDIDALGVANCVSINNNYWSGADLSAANGGTGLSTFGGTNTVLYTTSADTLASEAAFTYDQAFNRLTFSFASSTYITADTASTTNLFVSSLNCTGSNGGALTAVAGVITCSDDDGGAGGSSAASKWATTTGALSISPAGALRIGVGTTSPYGVISANGNTWPQLMLSDNSLTTGMKHWVASTTPFGKLAWGIMNDAFTSITEAVTFGTSTVDYAGYGGALVVGTTTSGAYYSLGTSTDQFFLNGRINTGDWHFNECAPTGWKTAQLTGDQTGSVISTTLGVPCPGWAFVEDTAGVLDETVMNGYAYYRLRAGNAGTFNSVAGEGFGIQHTTSWMNFASNTPKLSAKFRLAAVQNATTSLYMIGFGSMTGVSSDHAALPTYYVGVVSSTTENNWIAVVKNGNQWIYKNTGVASSSVLVGESAWGQWDISVSSTTAEFVYRGTNGIATTTNKFTAADGTYIPTHNGLRVTPITSTGKPTAGLQQELHVGWIRLWWRDLIY